MNTTQPKPLRAMAVYLTGIALLVLVGNNLSASQQNTTAQAQTQATPTAATTTNTKQWQFEFSANVIKKYIRNSEQFRLSCRVISGNCYGSTVTLANTMVDGIEWIDQNPPPACLRDSIAEIRRGFKSMYNGVVSMVRWFENEMKTSDDERANAQMTSANSILAITIPKYMQATKTCAS